MCETKPTDMEDTNWDKMNGKAMKLIRLCDSDEVIYNECYVMH